MRIAIAFDRFGPYHVARLAGAAAAFDAVLGLEYYAETGVYAWDKVERPSPFARITLFQGSRAKQPGGRALRQALSDALERFQPDAVAVPGWASREALATLEWCLAKKRPAILMSETQENDGARAGWKEAVKRRCVRLFASAIVGGDRHRAYLRKLGLPDNRIFAGYDAVDNNHFAQRAADARATALELRRRLNLPEDYFVASARFVPQKNLAGLLAAYASYRRDAGASAWHLALLGDGLLREQLRAQCSQLAVAEWVHWPGFQQYDSLPAYYALARALVHTSTIEPWGLVVNEAMACGLPVLVSNRCGAAALVCEGRNGFTFEPADTDAIARTMTKISTLEPAKREAMGGESRRIVAEWGADRFGRAMRQAAEAATALPRRKNAICDRLLLKVLSNRAGGGEAAP